MGYTNASVDVPARFSSGDAENLSFAGTLGRAYQTENGFLNILLGASHTSSDVETKRQVNIGRMNESLTADYEAASTQFYGELGYEIAMSDRNSFEPFVNLAWSRLSTDAYSESGGMSALESEGFDNDRLSSLVGVRFAHKFNLKSIPSRIHGTFGWEHIYGNDSASASHAFNGSSVFEVEGATANKNAAVMGLGMDFDINESMRLGVGYTGRVASEERDDMYHLKFSWSY